MSKDIKPIERLNDQDHRIAIDLGCACSLIITHLPSISQIVFSAISNEFSVEKQLPHNVAKYAMRTIGESLFESAWTFTVVKQADGQIITDFIPESDPIISGSNGDQAGS